MHKIRITLFTLLCLALTAAARAQFLPADAGLRYSEEISNSPAGSCGCFAMQGAAADAYWKLGRLAHSLHLGMAADAGVENTTNVNNAGYGLTLSAFTAGPRVKLHVNKAHPFAQALFGVAHGSGSNFPQSGSLLIHSANSFALDLGAGADYPLNKRLSVRFLQLDYLRTALPNNSNNWQNNLRVSAGLTLRISH
jgi:opacity protein-like surface antigen